MRPFPPASELQFLIGLEVGQICLDPWSTQVRFADGGQMTITGRFEHMDVRGLSHWHQAEEEQDLGPVYLRDLLQQRITFLQREPNCLTLGFGNGAILRIWSEISAYENGGIFPPGEGDAIIF